jgi:RNA 3'-terminal phosphate cyclase (ATP)
VFEPGAVRAGDYAFAVGTAGSCTLVLQTVWPALMLADAPSRLRLAGGTHNPMAPPYHFLERSFAPLVRRLGAGVDLQLRRLGFYPAGGGEIEATVHPAGEALRPFDLLERGPLREAFAESLSPGLPQAVSRRELDTLGRALDWAPDQLRMPIVRQNEGPGNVLMATLAHEHVTEVITRFGEKSVSAERVAKAVADEVRRWQAGDAALGPHLADQWTLPLALATWKRDGTAAFTCTELTDHATTNFATIERFLPLRFETAARGRGFEVRVSSTA